MQVIVCGSMAFDNIMVFQGRFSDQIDAKKIHILNVSFLVETMRQCYGGCAGNIAYNSNLLGIDVCPLGTVGKDFAGYAKWLEQNNISQEYILSLEDTYTASAFITTDIDNNQIAAFHPGAMNRCHEIKVPQHKDLCLGLISPEGREGMLQHAQQFIDQKIPYIFDPGQGVSMFNQEEMLFFIEGATWLACNDYEFGIVQKTSGLSVTELVKKVNALFVTQGSNGSTIYTRDETTHVPVAQPEQVIDPTGCGDAYRAGIIYGLINELSLKDTGNIAALMGTIQVEHEGTQSHSFEMEDFAKLFEKHFSYALPKKH